MSLKAQIRADIFGNFIIHMNGGLDYESTPTLRSELQGILEKNPTSTITLDLFNLDFVGSSGLSHFVDTIKYFNQNGPKVRLANVKSEFVQVFKLYNLEQLEEIISDFESDETENLGTYYGKNKTFSV